MTMVRVFNQRSAGSVIIRMNIEVPNLNIGKLTEPGFCPKRVSCRPWMSRNKYFKSHQSNSTNYDNVGADTYLNDDVAYKSSHISN